MDGLWRALTDPKTALGVSPQLLYGALVSVLVIALMAIPISRFVRARVEAVRKERRRLAFDQSDFGRELREEGAEERRRRAEANQRQLARYDAGELTTMTRPRIRVQSGPSKQRDDADPGKPGLRYRKRQ